VLPGSKIYFAKKGDTVESIAKEHRVEETAILTLNPKLLPGSGGVPVNHPVQLPDLEAERESPAEEDSASAPDVAASGNPSASEAPPRARPAEEPGPERVPEGAPQTSGQTHTVVKGENPYGIARKYGVTQEELMELNGITDPRKVQIGTVLKIPQKP
jgi:LysM repeat protein